MKYEAVMPVVLAAVLLTDASLAILFTWLWLRLRQTASTASEASLVAAELAALLAQMRSRGETAAAELERQRTELKRLLEANAAAPSQTRTARLAANVPGRISVLQAEGNSLYATARRAGVSLEEVRLSLATERMRTSA